MKRDDTDGPKKKPWSCCVCRRTHEHRCYMCFCGQCSWYLKKVKDQATKGPSLNKKSKQHTVETSDECAGDEYPPGFSCNPSSLRSSSTRGNWAMADVVEDGEICPSPSSTVKEQKENHEAEKKEDGGPLTRVGGSASIWDYLAKRATSGTRHDNASQSTSSKDIEAAHEQIWNAAGFFNNWKAYRVEERRGPKEIAANTTKNSSYETDAVKPGKETKWPSSWKEIPRPSETTHLLERQIPEAVSPVQVVVEIRLARKVKEESVQKETSSASSLKKTITNIQPVVETELTRNRKEASVPREASSAPSLKNPNTSDAVEPGKETKWPSSLNDIPRPSESTCLLERQISEPVSSVQAAVETRLARKRKEVNLEKETSSASSLKKPSTYVPVQPAVETELARNRKEASVPEEASSDPSLKNPSTSDAVKPGKEIKCPSSWKEIPTPSESTQLLEGQIPERVSSVQAAVETRLARKRKEVSLEKETSSASSLKKPSIYVQPALETELARNSNEASVPREASSAPSLKNPSTSVRAGVETRLARKRKDASLQKETSSVSTLKKPSTYEIELARNGKELSVPREASSDPSLKNPSTSGHQVNGEIPPRVPNTKNKEMMSSEAEKFSRVPARDYSWKGQLKILNKSLHNMIFVNEAHPCSRGSRKVLECSRRMPHLLQFELIKRDDIWKDLFLDGCATEYDIGLYFYPGTEDGSSNYGLALAIMEGQDLALRCVLDKVELYVFPSKSLPADYHMLDGHPYLWGMFHKMRKHKDAHGASSSVPFQKKPIPDCPPRFEKSHSLKIGKF